MYAATEQTNPTTIIIITICKGRRRSCFKHTCNSLQSHFVVFFSHVFKMNDSRIKFKCWEKKPVSFFIHHDATRTPRTTRYFKASFLLFNCILYFGSCSLAVHRLKKKKIEMRNRVSNKFCIMMLFAQSMWLPFSAHWEHYVLCMNALFASSRILIVDSEHKTLPSFT